MTNTLHAHVSTSSRDCDGGHGYDYIAGMNDDERAAEDSEWAFQHRILEGKVSLHSEFGMTLKVDSEGFEWHETTDEGYQAGEVRWCRDDCDVDGYRGQVYDQYAQMMGY